MIMSIRRQIHGDDTVSLHDGAQVTKVHRAQNGTIWLHAKVDTKQPIMTLEVKLERWQGQKPQLRVPNGFIFIDDVPAESALGFKGNASVFVAAVPPDPVVIPALQHHLRRAFTKEGAPA